MQTCESCGTLRDESVEACPTCDVGRVTHYDSEGVGKPVVRLDLDDPVNRALGAAQLMFNELYGRCQGFIDEVLHLAAEKGLVGWVDVGFVEMSDAGFRVAVRMRQDGSPPRTGKQWWHIPVNPEVLAELFERIKPAPREVKPVDVDASAPLPPTPRTGPAAILRARQRESAALASNLKRTQDDLVSMGTQVDLKFATDVTANLAVLLGALAADLGGD